MRSLIRATDLIARTGAGIAFALLMLSVLIQLAGRGGWIPAQIWTEESARFCLLYLAAFGVGPALRSGDLVNVDLFSESLRDPWPWRLRLLSSVVIAGTCFLLVPAAWFYTSIGSRQTAPSVGVRMDFIHASVLVLLVLLGIFATLRAVSMLTGIENGQPVRSEGDQ